MSLGNDNAGGRKTPRQQSLLSVFSLSFLPLLINTPKYTQTHTHTHTHTRTHTHAHTHFIKQTHALTHTNTHTYTYGYTRKHTLSFSSIHTGTYTKTQSLRIFPLSALFHWANQTNKVDWGRPVKTFKTCQRFWTSF